MLRRQGACVQERAYKGGRAPTRELSSNTINKARRFPFAAFFFAVINKLVPIYMRSGLRSERRSRITRPRQLELFNGYRRRRC